MNFPFLRLLMFVTFIPILFGCGKVKQFSASAPYAVELARMRSYYPAQKIENRLRKMKVPVYMILLADEMDQSSKWYVLLTGAEKDTVSASKLKVELDLTHQLKGLKILNYKNVKPHLLTLERKKIDEIENIAATQPDLPKNIYDLVEKFPKNDLLNVEKVALFNFSDGKVPSRYFQNFYNTSLDLPRGVAKSIVAKKAEAFAEVIYKDNLYGDRVTVDVLKLASNNGIEQQPRARLINNTGTAEDFRADHIAWYFASLILNTGTYLTENYEKIVVNSYTTLYGYKVVIEPRQDYLRTYMILVDVVGGFVVFSQSTDKSDPEILDYLAGFGKSNGMLDFSEFHNTFFTIPKCLEDGDVFLGYSSSILGNDYAASKGYADWARAMVGHQVSRSEFYSQKLKMPWLCDVFDLLTSSKKDYIYNDMYRNKDYAGRTAVKVNDSNGFYVGNFFYNEVNFATSGRHVFAVGGAGMPKQALLNRAEKFQTGAALPGKDPCGEKPNPPEPPKPDPTEPPVPPVDTPSQTNGKAPESECGTGKIVTSYNSSDANYHHFRFETVLLDKNLNRNWTQEKMYRLLLQEAWFVLPSKEFTPVEVCKIVQTDFTLYKDNPVLLKINEGNLSVTGYSLPGHYLHPCRFSRTIKVQADKIIIVTEGEVISKQPAIQEWTAHYFWKKADSKLMERFKSQTI